MLYIHESNIINKIRTNYKGKGAEIQDFYNKVYLKYREKLNELNYSSENIQVFKDAAMLMDDYLIEVNEFEESNGIASQSKFRSTFIEEISAYLFKDLKLIEENILGVYNKNVYAGMKINNQMHIDIIPKDVDFCIGKKIILKIDESQTIEVIIPIVCVEVKTYLDATMFGEVQYSSKQIKNASPNVKTYVLMEYNDVAKEKIVAARYDNNLNEMFVLRDGTRKDSVISSISPEVLLDYYREIKRTIDMVNSEDVVNSVGRLLKLKKETD